VETEYFESLENKSLAERLQERYHPFIGYVDLSKIYFAEMIGYEPKNAKPYVMSGVTQGWVRQVLNTNPKTQGKDYCLAVWQEKWSMLEDTKKQWIIFKAIYSVSPQGDGKIRNFDVMDYGFIVEYFVHMGMGPYWEIKEGLPDLLKSPDPLPLIIPMEDD
jgi:hypothetical protein